MPVTQYSKMGDKTTGHVPLLLYNFIDKTSYRYDKNLIY